MRFIYKILFGLIAFNAFLVFLSPIFNFSNVGGGLTDPTGDSEYDQYEDVGNQDLYTGMITTGGGVFAVAIIGTLLTKSLVWLGAGSFIALVTALWVGGQTAIMRINITNNSIIFSIISLLGICIGILAVISVVEMFAGQQGGDI